MKLEEAPRAREFSFVFLWEESCWRHSLPSIVSDHKRCVGIKELVESSASDVRHSVLECDLFLRSY